MCDVFGRVSKQQIGLVLHTWASEGGQGDKAPPGF